eukprot:gnl/Chilomastix_caulleri/7556.p2 GENE.gnl/Chilomastix_caulleri/7556~~gnl/Chilomastix_caulleri/7556.p2  ORF type:complete len:57 (+),score=8.91 gnl/Chilomastix_caulleri/7556:215-385(+)
MKLYWSGPENVAHPVECGPRVIPSSSIDLINDCGVAPFTQFYTYPNGFNGHQKATP